MMDVKLLSDGYFFLDKGLLVYGKTQYYGQKYKCALKPLLVRSREERVLIDTGIGELPEKYRKFYPTERKITLEKSLKKEGLRPEDITIVINTHLHMDHCGNNCLFKSAKFYVQQDEVEYANAPHRFQKGGYMKEMFGPVSYIGISGEMEIIPGVKVFRTPGHTPGHQSVIIDNEDKTYIYCGDVAPLRENLEDRNIVGILYNPVQALESIDVLRGINGIHIYSHDNEQMSL